MRQRFILVALAASASSVVIVPAGAQTLRNPPGTTTPATTQRNPVGSTGATPQTPHSQPNASPDQATRPTLGSGNPALPGANGAIATAPGHNLGAGPNAPQGANGTGAGGGAPNALNPSGANAGTASAGLSAARPNGGAASNGSKSAPMQANGVRKIQ